MDRYRISELAERVGVPPTTLRYYESRGLLPARRTGSGYRTYDDRDVERMRFITTAKTLGLPLDRIRDHQTGQPRAQRYDGGGGGLPSGVSDPTGEAALRADGASRDMRNIVTKLRSAGSLADDVEHILSCYPAPHPPSAYERQLIDMTNTPHCEVCAKVDSPHIPDSPWIVEPLTVDRTTVNDTLDEPLWLCRWCWEHVHDRGCKPNEDETTQHRDGKRVICRHPLVESAA